MTPLLWLLASWIVRAWCAVVRPSSFTCPPPLVINGVRPSGDSTCYVPPPGRGELECARGQRCTFEAEAPVGLALRIYCGPGEQAVVVDHRRVRCRPTRSGA